MGNVVGPNTVAVPCVTVIVALVKSRLSMCAVQFLFGHPAVFAFVGCVGGSVVTINDLLPFFGSASLLTLATPVRMIGAGFCPGD